MLDTTHYTRHTAFRTREHHSTPERSAVQSVPSHLYARAEKTQAEGYSKQSGQARNTKKPKTTSNIHTRAPACEFCSKWFEHVRRETSLFITEPRLLLCREDHTGMERSHFGVVPRALIGTYPRGLACHATPASGLPRWPRP